MDTDQSKSEFKEALLKERGPEDWSIVLKG